MHNENYEQQFSFVKESIIQSVFVRDKRVIGLNFDELAWIMDFRSVMLEPCFIDAVTILLYEKIRKCIGVSFQIGGMEVAAVPLITSLVMKSIELQAPISGFFIRKSRKKTGLLNMFEGQISGKPIVLVDDIMNSGSSFLRQIEALEKDGKKVAVVIVILRYREEEYYQELNKRGIKILSLFELNDFKSSLGVSNVKEKEVKLEQAPYKTKWYFASDSPHLEYVMPKSALLLYEDVLYFGADNGYFWAINSHTGDPIWKHKILFGSGSKFIFSSPCAYKGTIFFGAYDGNFYALNAKTGKREWVTYDADAVGSSPCISEKLEYVYVGMEYGFWKKKGGVTAYRCSNGEKMWSFFADDFTHGSPTYSQVNGMVICGSNEGRIYALNAKTGALCWSYDSFGEVKAGCALSPNERYVCVGTFSKKYVVLEVKTGKVIATLETLEANYSTPVWKSNTIVVCASLDRCLYCFDVEKKQILWKYKTFSRIFASPVIYKNVIYFGNNAARLHALDAETGKELEVFQTVERITNKVTIDPKTETLYMLTFANEVIALDISGRKYL